MYRNFFRALMKIKIKEKRNTKSIKGNAQSN